MTVRVLTFSGALDIAHYPDFREAFQDVRAGGSPVIVDLSDVTLVDSTFLTELLMFARRVESSRSPVGVVLAKGNVMRVFDIAQLGGRLRLFRSVEEAARELEREAACE